MEQCLRALLSSGQASGFSVIYSDMHGLWGGTTITLAGTGAYERSERARGAQSPTVLSKTLSTQQVHEVVGLLLELGAWEQQAPALDRLPVPDESWATLEIRCGGAETRTTERHRELEAQQRLIRVRALLHELGERGATS